MCSQEEEVAGAREEDVINHIICTPIGIVFAL
jgi:hypothetical protein